VVQEDDEIVATITNLSHVHLPVKIDASIEPTVGILVKSLGW